jgi:hypothetical protein
VLPQRIVEVLDVIGLASQNALDEKAQEPLELDTHRATHTAQRNPFQQQAFETSPSISRDEILLEALGKLTPTVVAVMIVLAVMTMTRYSTENSPAVFIRGGEP